MDAQDHAFYSKIAGALPYKIDAAFLALGITSRFSLLKVPQQTTTVCEIRFHHDAQYKDFPRLRPGWKPTAEAIRFFTFTTAQPAKKTYAPRGAGTGSPAG